MIEICVCFSPAAREVIEEVMKLPKDACVMDALSTLPQQISGQIFIDPHPIKLAFEKIPKNVDTLLKPGYQVAIWSKPVPLDLKLKGGERLEILRPIKVDPKIARKERFKQQGAKAAGLFARRRPGAKAGY